jgi:hypothetical protein
MWSDNELENLTGFRSVGALDFSDFAAVALITPHSVWAEQPAFTVGWHAGQLVFDAQGAWAKHELFFRALDVEYTQVGRAGWLRK